MCHFWFAKLYQFGTSGLFIPQDNHSVLFNCWMLGTVTDWIVDSVLCFSISVSVSLSLSVFFFSVFFLCTQHFLLFIWQFNSWLWFFNKLTLSKESSIAWKSSNMGVFKEWYYRLYHNHLFSLIFKLSLLFKITLSQDWSHIASTLWIEFKVVWIFKVLTISITIFFY